MRSIIYILLFIATISILLHSSNKGVGIIAYLLFTCCYLFIFFW